MAKKTSYLRCILAMLDEWVRKYNHTIYNEDYMFTEGLSPIHVDIDQETWDRMYIVCLKKEELEPEDVKPLTDVIHRSVNSDGIRLNLRGNLWLYCGRIYPILGIDKSVKPDITLDQLPTRLM